MKIVMAIIKPFKLDEVRDALTATGVHGMTVTEVQRLRAPEGPHGNLPRCRVCGQFPAEDQDRSGVRDRPSRQDHRSHHRAAKTGQIGDGKIFVLDLESAVRIRTGGNRRCGDLTRTYIVYGQELTMTFKKPYACGAAGFSYSESCSAYSSAFPPSPLPMPKSRHRWADSGQTVETLACDSKVQKECSPNSGDTAWMLTSMAIVLMMTIPGLALFYGGMVRKKNVATP